MSETARPPALDSLTGLRFFAAFHVVVFHYAQEGLIPWDWPRRFVEAGFHAVSLFFVLSGFILAYNYGDAFVEGRITRRSFWLARAARVYPLYFALVLVEIVIGLVVFHLPTKAVLLASLAHTALLQCWIPAYLAPGNRPDWSIATESFFYLLFPWLVIHLYRSQRRRILFGAIVLTWVLGMAVASVGASGLGETAGELILVSPAARCFEFAFGIGVGRLWLLDRQHGRRMNGTWVTLPALSLGLPLTLQEHAIPHSVFNNGLLAPFYACLIYGLAHGGSPRVLGSRPLIALGEASYALYLLQQPVFHVLDALGMPLAGLPARCGYFAILIAVSLVVHRGFERPIRGWIRSAKWHVRAERGDRPRDLVWLALPVALAIPLAVDAYGPRPHGVAYGAEPVAGIQESGFYGQESADGVPFRWTNGDATVRVPIGTTKPRRLRVHLQVNDSRQTTVDVRVNGQSLFSGRLPTIDWSETLPLDNVPLDGGAEVRIQSSTFVPQQAFPGSLDVRNLGVRVFLISLE